MIVKKVNWGIISCADIADREVIPGIISAQNAQLFAVSSRSREKAEEFKNKHHATKAYDSYDKLLDDPDIDAVYIPLPNALHKEWVFKAAEKGKHILCEKPLGIHAQEVLEMKAACERHNVKLMEAFAYRHSPLSFKAKELADSGTVGKLKVIEAWFSFNLNDLNNVRLKKDLGGGATYDVGCYAINIIRYIAGNEPVKVMAAGEAGSESGVDESSCMLFEFEGGLKAMAHCSFNSAPRSGYRIVGETGIIEVDVTFNARGELNIKVIKGDSTEVITVSTPNNYMLEVEQFGRCILEEETPLLSLDDSYGNAIVIDKVLEQIMK